MRFKLSVTLSGRAEWRAILDSIARLPHFQDPPKELGLEAQGFERSDWVKALKATKHHGIAFWENRKKQVSAGPGSNLAAFSIPGAFDSVPDAVDIMMKVEFGVAGIGAVFFDEWIEADYKRWAFSRGHIDHGWGCAFRGAGHDHLVSRRWLDFGPWRVIRRPNDTTFVQFHDLAITDPAEAYEIAKVGHERMGISHTGGFIQQITQSMLDDVSERPYTAHDRTLHMVVAAGAVCGDGKPLTQLRMLNAARLRRFYQLNPTAPQPVERIAFTFMVEEEARAHLHELWLRELECWVRDGDGLRRLDADYHPIPSPPEWVRRLDAK